MKIILPALFVAILSASCVSATVDVESVCSSKGFTLPGTPTLVSTLAGERTVQQDTDQDVSDALNKVGDFADVSLTTVQLTMNGELEFLHHVKVVLHSAHDGDLTLSDSDVSSNNSTVNVPVTVDKDELLARLRNGNVTLKVFATGNVPTQETAVTNTLCVGVSAHANKSLTDIVKK